MIPATYDLDIYASESARVDITLNNNTTPATPLNLSGYTARAQIRAAKKHKTVALEFTVTIATPATGNIILSATSTQTSALSEGAWYWDLIITSGTTVTPVLQGLVNVTQNVTR